MIVTQIAATVFVLSAIVTFVAAQFVDFKKDFNWIDYAGSAAMGLMAVSGVIALLAFIWGI